MDGRLCCHTGHLLWLPGYLLRLVLCLFMQLSVSHICDSDLLVHEAQNDQALHDSDHVRNRHLRRSEHSRCHFWLPHLWLEGRRRHHLKLFRHGAFRHGRSHRHGSQDLYHLSHIALLRQVCVLVELHKSAFLCSERAWTLC